MLDKEIKWRSKVFGSLRPDTISIHVAYGYGMNDGGGLWEIPRAKVPEDCRMPNTYVWVTLKRSEVVRIERMSDEEIEIYK